MTDYYMLRRSDEAGYYETRLILTLAAFVVALWFLVKKRDSRYLTILISGVVFQAFMEYLLQVLNLRGVGYHFSVFGAPMSGAAANLFQGLAEGGIFSLMAFWYLDLKAGGYTRQSRNAYLSVFGLIVVLACLVGYLSIGHAITSRRPMFGRTTIVYTSASILISVVLTAWKRGGLRYLWYFYVGLVIYSLVTFVPLQIFGARYIGERDAGTIATAPFLTQAAVMLSSHLIEVAAGKIYYFAIPFALGLLPFPSRGHETKIITPGSQARAAS